MEYMSDYPRCVVLERSVYVGGGDTGRGDDGYYIQVYNMDADVCTWEEERQPIMMRTITYKNTTLMLRSGVVYRDIDTSTLL